jgi:hypothetical protein
MFLVFVHDWQCACQSFLYVNLLVSRKNSCGELLSNPLQLEPLQIPQQFGNPEYFPAAVAGAGGLPPASGVWLLAAVTLCVIAQMPSVKDSLTVGVTKTILTILLTPAICSLLSVPDRGVVGASLRITAGVRFVSEGLLS